VSGRGIGFVFFLKSDSPQVGPLETLRISFGSINHDIHPTTGVLILSEEQIAKHLHGALTNSDNLSQRHDMLALLSEEAEFESASGMIDFYGYHHAAGGWLFCGWIDRGWSEGVRRGNEENICCGQRGIHCSGAGGSHLPFRYATDRQRRRVPKDVPLPYLQARVHPPLLTREEKQRPGTH
jgi:hypothetical protein